MANLTLLCLHSGFHWLWEDLQLKRNFRVALRVPVPLPWLNFLSFPCGLVVAVNVLQFLELAVKVELNL